MTGRHPWAKPGIEPPLAELLLDPITVAVMAVDGVEMNEVLAVVERARARLTTLRLPSTLTDEAPRHIAVGIVT